MEYTEADISWLHVEKAELTRMLNELSPKSVSARITLYMRRERVRQEIQRLEKPDEDEPDWYQEYLRNKPMYEARQKAVEAERIPLYYDIHPSMVRDRETLLRLIESTQLQALYMEDRAAAAEFEQEAIQHDRALISFLPLLSGMYD